MMEALACHPLGKFQLPKGKLIRNKSNTILDTIKVRMQLSRRARAPGVGSTSYMYTMRRDNY